MLMKFFILPIAILGIAIRLSSGEQAREAIIKGYRETIAQGISLKFILSSSIGRGADCPNAGTINRAMNVVGDTRVCEFCVCGDAATGAMPVPANCDQIPCFPLSGPAPPTDIANSWDSTSATPPVWTTIQDATPFQVYTVDDGFCYATDVDKTIGRTMRCFAHP